MEVDADFPQAILRTTRNEEPFGKKKREKGSREGEAKKNLTETEHLLRRSSILKVICKTHGSLCPESF